MGHSVARCGMISMGSENDDSTTPARMAAIDHFEWVLRIQIDHINHTDDKAISHITFVGAILLATLFGVGLLTGMETGASGLVEDAPNVALLGFVVAVCSLLLSIAYGAITVAVGRCSCGPGPAIQEALTEGHLERSEYAELMLRGYIDAIAANEHVVERARDRFRKANSAFLVGLVALVVSTVFYADGSDRPVEYLVLFLATGFVWSLHEYVLPCHRGRFIASRTV